MKELSKAEINARWEGKQPPQIPEAPAHKSARKKIEQMSVEEQRATLVGVLPLYEKLPTGKPHISFSELREWKECSYRHKLKYVDAIGDNMPGVHMDFGTAVHSACESFLKTGKMDTKVFKIKLHTLWSEHQKILPKEYTASSFKQFASEGLAILPEIPGWFDETFPGWKFVDAEHQLYEGIDGHQHAFKGFIDCIITAPGPKDKQLYWLLDFKTCGWGWAMAKKTDELVRMQLVFYKSFWAKKANIDAKDIRCGFVLLKRTAKPGNRCELVTTSVGDVVIKRSLTVIDNMLSSVKKGLVFKNRHSCDFCEFHQTQHCT